MPPSLIELAIEPKLDDGWQSLVNTLERISTTDRSLFFSADKDSRQIILSGQSETHLDETISALKNLTTEDFNVGAPQIAYRETITNAVDIDYTYHKHLGGTIQYAHVKFTVSPKEPNFGFEFESDVADSVIPALYVSGFREGVESIQSSGLLVGFPIIGFNVVLYGGSHDDVESSKWAFETAARLALREYKTELGLALLEPIMNIELTTPDNYIDPITNDLISRRWNIIERKADGRQTVLLGTVPLGQMFGYENFLWSLTNDKARYEMQFSHYARVPSANDEGDPPSPGAIALRA